MFCAVGTSILGYSNNNIKKSVLKNINKGNMTTLICPEEVYLSKKSLSIILGRQWLNLLEVEEKLMH